MRPVATLARLLCSILSVVSLSVASLLWSVSVYADFSAIEDATYTPPGSPDEPREVPRYQAVLELHSASELKSVLQRAEQLVSESQQNGYPDREPVAFILYGDEIRLFAHEHYEKNRDLVDLAARLEAFRVVDLKVCSSWLNDHGIKQDDLPPFLDSVPYGPDEVQRLQESGYAYF
jgi:uncharacterized protein